MDDNKYWVSIWALVIFGLGFLATLCTINEIDNNKTILNMVKAGANPIDAKCAISPSTSTVDCNIIYSKR